MKCWYCPRPVYRLEVCFTHWLRFMRTVYGEEAALAAMKNAPVADTASA